MAGGDFNADSRPDLAVANFDSNDVSVLLNNPATGGDDVLVGDAQDNVICGLAGSDVIRGGAGHDTLYGDRCGAGARVPAAPAPRRRTAATTSSTTAAGTTDSTAPGAPTC